MVVGLEAGFGGSDVVGGLCLGEGGGGLLHHEVDDMAIADGLAVVLGYLAVGMGDVAHGGRRGGVEVTDELAIAVDHRDAEERAVFGVTTWVVAQGLVYLCPVFKDIVKSKHFI